MSDLLHTHLTIGYAPVGECPACDQVREILDNAPVLESAV